MTTLSVNTHLLPVLYAHELVLETSGQPFLAPAHEYVPIYDLEREERLVLLIDKSISCQFSHQKCEHTHTHTHQFFRWTG